MPDANAITPPLPHAPLVQQSHHNREATYQQLYNASTHLQPSSMFRQDTHDQVQSVTQQSLGYRQYPQQSENVLQSPNQQNASGMVASQNSIHSHPPLNSTPQFQQLPHYSQQPFQNVHQHPSNVSQNKYQPQTHSQNTLPPNHSVSQLPLLSRMELPLSQMTSYHQFSQSHNLPYQSQLLHPPQQSESHVMKSEQPSQLPGNFLPVPHRHSHDNTGYSTPIYTNILPQHQRNLHHEIRSIMETNKDSTSFSKSLAPFSVSQSRDNFNDPRESIPQEVYRQRSSQPRHSWEPEKVIANGHVQPVSKIRWHFITSGEDNINRINRGVKFLDEISLQ